MKIGIVSDTHGRADVLRVAVARLLERGVQAVVHCGDLGSKFCLDALGGLGVPVYAVGGNMDRALTDLERLADIAGVTFARDSLAFSVGENACVAVAHGHDPHVLAGLMDDPANQFVLHGHSHCRRDEHVAWDDREDPVHVINPGALRDPRDGAPAAMALLDTDNDTVEFIDLP